MVITKYFTKNSQKQILTGEEIYINPQITVLLANGWIEMNEVYFQSLCVTEQQAILAAQQEIQNTVALELPSLSAINTAINNCTTIAHIKAFLLKQVKVDYQHITGKTT